MKSMKFFYKFARLPENRELLSHIDSATNRLFEKLRKLSINALKISDYNKKYLESKVASLITNLQIYSYILSWSIAKSNGSLDRFVFLDYGGGSGILSLLAKELGIGTVIYNDIYEISCQDAQEIGKSVGNLADYYVQGDIGDIVVFFKKNKIDCNVIASYDVIEHIYDIESFFEKIPTLSNNPMSVVMSSGANTFNPLIRKRLMKKQIEEENRDRESKYGHKERDCLRSYFNVRKDMIIEYSKECNKVLTGYEVEELATRTRGKIEADIKKCADEYFKTKWFPQGPNHPTNTCDPYTGNWTEHLMDPYWLAEILVKRGFEARVFSGYYGRSKSLAKRVIGKFLNVFISKFERQGIRTAPFYTIYGRRD
jgi:2-polyprenyl-3-methyl-5-hydroxy-6-metoxy-1,4-benzoquinol methylase